MKYMKWRFKIVVKLLLKMLPLPYSFWKKIGVFQHGAMENVDFSYNVWKHHAINGGVLCDSGVFNANIGVVLELGPGDSFYSGLFSLAAGAQKAIAVDVGDFAQIGDNLRKQYTDKIEDEFGEVIISSAVDYRVEGIDSLRTLKEFCVDYSYSNAVLEHVLKESFHDFARQLYRVMKCGGVSVHRVDLRDHLGGGLNNLRFSPYVWESAIFQEAGFYTNRLRMSEIVNHFESVGFVCEIIKKDHWLKMPLKLNKVHVELRNHSESEFLVKGFDIKLIKPCVE